MHKAVTLQSHYKIVGQVEERFTTEQFADETMLFAADPNYAAQFGGPITKAVINYLDRLYLREPAEHQAYSAKFPNPIIDTRVHMLMPGMYPAIPGWHLDHTPRNETNGQPVPEKANPNQKSIVVILATQPGVSRTEYVSAPYGLTFGYDPERVWGTIDEYIERNRADIDIHMPAENQLILLNGQCLHRATPCQIRGWRYFLRLSWFPPEHKAENKIRRQVQVYTTAKTGW